MRDDTSEVIVGIELGVVKARDFKRLSAESERWSAELVMNLCETLWEPTPGKPGNSVPVRIRLPEEGENRENPEPEPVNLGGKRTQSEEKGTNPA